MLKSLVAVFTAGLLAAYLGSGTRYALYSPARSSNFIWGVYHVHSTMSDGLESPEGIARQARIAGVSLVLLTDHGNPNVAASTFHKLIEGVTLVGGSEAKLPQGRLTFFGVRDSPRFALSSFPPQAIDQARGWGGFSVLAYAEDPRYGWHYWEPDLAPNGIEVSNLFTCIRGLSIADKILLALYYPFSHYYFLKSISYPAQSIARWDDLLQRGKTWALIAADAHGGFHLGRLSVRIPSYADTFSLAGLGIDRKYSSQPEAAIRSGDFFTCIRGAGEPLAFDFSASSGGAKFTSGSDAPENSDLHLRIKAAGQAIRLVLKKNGNVERQLDGDRLDIPKADGGVYRLEVYLLNHSLLPANVPWIVSNPIFVGNMPSTSHRIELYATGTAVSKPQQVVSISTVAASTVQ